MRLTRGCRAGGGVACSSLEYGGIRAATRRTPAPHDRLLLAFSASSRPPRPSPFHPRRALPLSSPATLSPRNIGAVLQALPPSPLPPPCRVPVSSAGTAPTTVTTTTFPFLSEGYSPACCTFGKETGKMDRRKKAGAESGGEKEGNCVYLSRVTH